MPAKVAFERVPSPFHEVEPADIDIETPDKANAMFFAVQPLRISDTHEDYPAMVLANFMLGGGFLNSRLATRIRQEEGLSYGVGSGFAADPIDESGSFQVFAIYAPENKAALEAAFEDEMRKLLTDGFTADELDAARNGWLQQQTVARSNDQGLRVTHQQQPVLRPDHAVPGADLEDRVRALTVQQVNDAVRRHIDPEPAWCGSRPATSRLEALRGAPMGQTLRFRDMTPEQREQLAANRGEIEPLMAQLRALHAQTIADSREVLTVQQSDQVRGMLYGGPGMGRGRGPAGGPGGGGFRPGRDPRIGPGVAPGPGAGWRGFYRNRAAPAFRAPWLYPQARGWRGRGPGW
jgi:hypothetical protein